MRAVILLGGMRLDWVKGEGECGGVVCVWGGEGGEKEGCSVQDVLGYKIEIVTKHMPANSIAATSC